MSHPFATRYIDVSAEDDDRENPHPHHLDNTPKKESYSWMSSNERASFKTKKRDSSMKKKKQGDPTAKVWQTIKGEGPAKPAEDLSMTHADWQKDFGIDDDDFLDMMGMTGGGGDGAADASALATIDEVIAAELGHGRGCPLITVDLVHGHIDIKKQVQFLGGDSRLFPKGGVKASAEQAKAIAVNNHEVMDQVAHAMLAVAKVCERFGLPPAKFDVDGHTHAKPEMRGNQSQVLLSEKRAKACVEDLKKNGIAAGVLDAWGHGGVKRRYEEERGEDPKMNQRVEFNLKNGHELAVAANDVEELVAAARKAAEAAAAEREAEAAAAAAREAEEAAAAARKEEELAAAAREAEELAAAVATAAESHVEVTIDDANDNVTIALSGPAGVWYGVGLNASDMKNAPWALIVDGQGKVTERKLQEDQSPGAVLASSVTVVSSVVQGGLRNVTLTRPLKGLTADHYTFDASNTAKLPFINVVGIGPGQHEFDGETHDPPDGGATAGGDDNAASPDDEGADAAAGDNYYGYDEDDANDQGGEDNENADAAADNEPNDDAVADPGADVDAGEHAADVVADGGVAADSDAPNDADADGGPDAAAAVEDDAANTDRGEQGEEPPDNTTAAAEEGADVVVADEADATSELVGADAVVDSAAATEADPVDPSGPALTPVVEGTTEDADAPGVEDGDAEAEDGGGADDAPEATVHDSIVIVDGEMPPWIHNTELGKSAAEALMLEPDGSYADGTFLLRLKKQFDPMDPNYILSIVYKGEPSSLAGFSLASRCCVHCPAAVPPPALLSWQRKPLQPRSHRKHPIVAHVCRACEVLSSDHDSHAFVLLPHHRLGDAPRGRVRRRASHGQQKYHEGCRHR